MASAREESSSADPRLVLLDVEATAEAVRQVALELADRLSLALLAGRIGTWSWDKRSGRTQWDEAMERLAGLEPGSFPGTFEAWVGVLHPDDAPTSQRTLELALETGGHYAVEHRFVWPDGSVHWIEGRGMVLADDDGSVIGAIGCSVDITDRKHDALQTLDAAVRYGDRLSLLVGINRAALAADSTQALMRAVTSAAVPELGDWCALHFLREPNAYPEIEVSHHDPARVAWARELMAQFPYDPDARTGVAAVIRTGEPEFMRVVDPATIDAIIAASPHDREKLHEIVDSLHLTSVLTLPLQTKRGVVGAMQFVSAESGRIYTDEDQALAQAAAGAVATALELLSRAERDHDTSVALQVALLPPALPAIDGLSLAARYWPAGATTQVGGDFYDVFEIGPESWAVVIGDVCGTGPDAASVTAIARHTIRAAARHGIEHCEVLDWLNEAILTSNRDRFCTTLYSTITKRSDGRWDYATVSGGHPLPIVVRADGTTETVGRHGTLVGVFPTIRSSVATTVIGPGDRIVLYTDGVTDVRPPFGLDEAQILELVTGATDGAETADLAIERIRAAVAAVLPMSDRNDDIALLVLQA